jgi:ribosomal protein L11 methyltransferase
LIRLAVRVPRDRAELVLAELLELAPDGVEEVELGSQTEFAVYGAPGELPSLPALRAAVGDVLVEIDAREIADDWEERWREFHRPVMIAAPIPRPGGYAPPWLRVRPPWEAPQAISPGAQEIVIDPGQAFGTGGHATTRLCLELLLALAASERPAGPLLDVGTGSGVLAIAAAKLGFAPVLALDNDPISVEAARANASLNGVELQVTRWDLREGALPAPKPYGGNAAAPVVVSNLLRGLLLELAGSLQWTPRELIASGLLAGEATEIARAFEARHGLRERARRSGGEWEALWLTGP